MFVFSLDHFTRLSYWAELFRGNWSEVFGLRSQEQEVSCLQSVTMTPSAAMHGRVNKGSNQRMFPSCVWFLQ